MHEERLSELEQICERATPGPWIDLAQTYFERCLADKRLYGNRWYHGSERASKPLALIVRAAGRYGEPFRAEDIPRRVDKFDLAAVVSLFWSALPKGRTVATEGFLSPEDTAFITAARTALPEALAEIRRLRAALDGDGA